MMFQLVWQEKIRRISKSRYLLTENPCGKKRAAGIAESRYLLPENPCGKKTCGKYCRVAVVISRKLVWQE